MAWHWKTVGQAFSLSITEVPIVKELAGQDTRNRGSPYRPSFLRMLSSMRAAS